MTESDQAKAGPRILICEKDIVVAGDLSRTLENLGYEVAGTVSTGSGDTIPNFPCTRRSRTRGTDVLSLQDTTDEMIGRPEHRFRAHAGRTNRSSESSMVVPRGRRPGVRQEVGRGPDGTEAFLIAPRKSAKTWRLGDSDSPEHLPRRKS